MPSKMRSINALEMTTENGSLVQRETMITAENFAGAKRQHFIREEADVNCANCIAK